MKGFPILSAWIICLFAGFLLQQTTTVTAIYTMNQTCAQIADGFIADPDNCQSYGYCKNGQLQGKSLCPKGYIYNARKAVCDIPSTGGCHVANVASACQYAADKSFVPDPTNCKRYCYCNNKVAEIRECPQNQVYDSKQTRCIWSSQMTSKCIADSICRLVPDGTFAGDPDNCGQYIACSNGIGTPGQCPKSKYFNKRIGMCQDNNPCQTPTPAGVGLGVLVPLASNADVCKKLEAPFPKYVTDGKTCMGYYLCSSAAGPGLWNKCPLGLHFNEGACVTPYSFACAYDRCANINQTFVGAINSQCKHYLICKTQTSQGPASGYIDYAGLPCLNGQYFNEFSQICDKTSPTSQNYKLCP